MALFCLKLRKTFCQRQLNNNNTNNNNKNNNNNDSNNSSKNNNNNNNNNNIYNMSNATNNSNNKIQNKLKRKLENKNGFFFTYNSLKKQSITTTNYTLSHSFLGLSETKLYLPKIAY